MSFHSWKIARIFGGAASLFFLASVSSSQVQAQAVRGLGAVRVAGGFIEPVFVTAPHGDRDRLFVVQFKPARFSSSISRRGW